MLRLLEEFGLASRKVIPRNHLISVRQKTIHEIASDEAGGTGYKKFHGSTAIRVDCSGSILWKRYFAKALIQVNGSRKADIFLPSASDLA